MRSFWSDPYLWVHLAGIAALPVFLELCFLGLTMGDPTLPAVLEVALVALVGITPVLWMQWQRPFYIFSLLAVALRPDQLTVEQRKLLSQFKAPPNRIAAVLVPLVLVWILVQLHALAPLSAETLPSGNRGVGLGLAAIAFSGSNLFLQVPVSVLLVLLTRETTFAAIAPYPVEQISRDFTLLGWRVKQLLPPLVSDQTSEQSPANVSSVADTVAITSSSATNASDSDNSTTDTSTLEASLPQENDDPWTESTGAP